MKRLILVITVIAINLMLVLPVLAQQDEIPVFIDGLPVSFDVQPIIHNDRTLVPFRAIAEALDVSVSWDNESRTVYASNDGISICLPVDSRSVYINNKEALLDVPAIILNDRTLVPLRFFSEAFGCQVEWSNHDRVIRITSPPQAMSVLAYYALGSKEASSWTDLFGKPYPEVTPGNTDMVSEIAAGWFSVDKDGSLLTRSTTGWQRPDGWEDVIEAAKRNNIKVQMVVHVTDGAGTLSSLLNDDTAINRAVNEIIQESRLYDGVNLDFEGLGFNDEGEQLKVVQSRFTKLVKLLSERLHQENKTLTLSLHPPNSAYRGYDYRTLGELADKIIVMAYEYGSKPEPTKLVLQAVESALSDVPPGKLVLGISAPTETAESIITKVGIAKRYRLDGIALWRLGVIDPDMWNNLRATVDRRG